MAEVLLNKCPYCNGELVLDKLCQYSVLMPISNRGKLIKSRQKKVNYGSIDMIAVYCSNNDFRTDYEFNVVEPPHTGMFVKIRNDTFYLVTKDD